MVFMLGFIEKRRKKIAVLKMMNELQLKYHIPLLNIQVYFKSKRFIISKSKSEKGCFSGYDNAIYLSKDLNEKELRKVFMHEYGHAIDLFVGLHHHDIQKNHYFYSDTHNISKEVKEQLTRLFSKKYEKSQVDYYLNKNEYLPELFAQHMMGEKLPKELLEILDTLLKKFKFYHEQEKKGGTTYFDELNEKNFYDMLSVKKIIQNHPDKYEDMIQYIQKYQ